MTVFPLHFCVPGIYVVSPFAKNTGKFVMTLRFPSHLGAAVVYIHSHYLIRKIISRVLGDNASCPFAFLHSLAGQNRPLCPMCTLVSIANEGRVTELSRAPLLLFGQALRCPLGGTGALGACRWEQSCCLCQQGFSLVPPALHQGL